MVPGTEDPAEVCCWNGLENSRGRFYAADFPEEPAFQSFSFGRVPLMSSFQRALILLFILDIFTSWLGALTSASWHRSFTLLAWTFYHWPAAFSGQIFDRLEQDITLGSKSLPRSFHSPGYRQRSASSTSDSTKH